MPYKDPEKKKQWEKEHRQGKRHKVWMAVFYEDSSPYWADGLDEQGVATCVSPLHDRDRWTQHDEAKNPAHRAGELKVPHRHLVSEFENPVSYEDFVGFLEDAGIKSTNVKWAKSLRGMARYLTHMDSPDKARYDDGEVAEFGGASWREWTERTEDEHVTMQEMREFIVMHEIQDFWAFQYWCDQNQSEWSRLLDKRCYAIDKFIGSVRAWVKAGKPQQSWLAQIAGDRAEDAAPDPEG